MTIVIKMEGFIKTDLYIKMLVYFRLRKWQLFTNNLLFNDNLLYWKLISNGFWLLTIRIVLLEVIAIRLIALNVIVGGSWRYVAINSGRAESTRRLTIVTKLGRKLMDARERATKCWEIHYGTELQRTRNIKY